MEELRFRDGFVCIEEARRSSRENKAAFSTEFLCDGGVDAALLDFLEIRVCESHGER